MHAYNRDTSKMYYYRMMHYTAENNLIVEQTLNKIKKYSKYVIKILPHITKYGHWELNSKHLEV